MNKCIRLLLLFLINIQLFAQEASETNTSKSDVKGQLSAWVNYNSTNEYSFYSGARYIPQFNQAFSLSNHHLIDFEASVNATGFFALTTDQLISDRTIDAYRLWGRYSSEQFELRVGLQKIDFGTAVMLRALRWFDQVDPRDPLRLTNGVWGGLARYYFLNNTNIWLWGLYGNSNIKGMEVLHSQSKVPEIGARIQTPIPLGEAGISYHHRSVETDPAFLLVPSLLPVPPQEVSENRVGVDAKWDLIVGLWFEAAWTHKPKELELLANQEVLTVGTDYTFGIGSGLNVTLEHMVYSIEKDAFTFDDPVQFTALMANYPIGMFDNVSTIIYYDWVNKASYNFVNWFRQFDKTTLYVIGYWNPKNAQMGFTGSSQNTFGGKGLQIMFVYNH